MKHKELLIVPTVLPLNLGSSINVIRRLQKFDDFKGLTLQLDESHQKLLSRAYKEKKKLGVERVGHFYPIINFATLEDKPSYALGEEDFEDRNEAIETYELLSEIYNSVGNIAYVCSRNNAEFLKNIN